MLEDFLEEHRERLTITSNQWGFPIRVNDNVRLLGTDEYLLVELNDLVWPIPIDMSFFVQPTTIIDAIDVSSHQPRNLTQLITQLQPKHVIVKLYLRGVESVPQQYSIDQARSARDNGCTVGGYVWCYRTVSAEQTIVLALETAEKAQIQLPTLWLDIEEYDGQPGPSIAWIHEALAACESLGVRAGIYTAKWYWDKWHPGVTDFGDVPLWAAQYGPKPSLDQFKPFGGWTKAAGIQWTSEPIDQNVFNGAFVS